jgi:crotonobetainyl-CoA:carnitine CoA-transferase CaiB-like acyl-CoA transferase
MSCLGRLGIAAMPMASVEELLTDQHLFDVQMFETRHHATEGEIRIIRSAPIFDGDRSYPARLAPRLGEHTAEVLAEVGLSPEEVDQLTRAGSSGDSGGNSASSS